MPDRYSDPDDDDQPDPRAAYWKAAAERGMARIRDIMGWGER